MCRVGCQLSWENTEQFKVRWIGWRWLLGPSLGNPSSCSHCSFSLGTVENIQHERQGTGPAALCAKPTHQEREKGFLQPNPVPCLTLPLRGPARPTAVDTGQPDKGMSFPDSVMSDVSSSCSVFSRQCSCLAPFWAPRSRYRRLHCYLLYTDVWGRLHSEKPDLLPISWTKSKPPQFKESSEISLKVK